MNRIGECISFAGNISLSIIKQNPLQSNSFWNEIYILPALFCEQLYCVNVNYTYHVRTWLMWFSFNGPLVLLQILGEAFTNNIYQAYFSLRTHHSYHFKSWIPGHSFAKEEQTLGRDFLAWLDNSALYFWGLHCS